MMGTFTGTVNLFLKTLNNFTALYILTEIVLF